MLATVQQASFGIGTALLGAVFAQSLNHSGHYLQAALVGLSAEFCLMLILLCRAIWYHRASRMPRAVATAGAL